VVSVAGAIPAGGIRDRCGLYVGTLRHRRFSPAAHEFTYPTFMVLLDIDALPAMMRVSRLTSYNRWNWAAYDERDHFGDPRRPLRERLSADARRQGIELGEGPILLLTHLRYCGYCFNPVSFFYCFDESGALVHVMAEVRNTFGGAHNYWLRPGGAARVVRASAEKALYVSPFLPPALDYGFAFTAPGQRLVAQIDVFGRAADPSDGAAEHGGSVSGRMPLFDATLSLAHRPWTASAIRAVLRRHPLETVKVIAAIHWQAWRLWWKRIPVHPRPAPTTGEGPRHAVLPRTSHTAGDR
jgi:DUF1365 family protein